MHRPRVGTLGAAGLVLGLALALPAAADHENRSRPWWHQNMSRPRPAFGHAPGHAECDRPSGHRHGNHVRRTAYACAPCRHRYRDYGAFTRHLHHHHHVPFWRMPFVIVHAAVGWIFYG